MQNINNLNKNNMPNLTKNKILFNNSLKTTDISTIK